MMSVYHFFVRASRPAHAAAIPALALTLLLTLGPIAPQTLNDPSSDFAWKTECLDCPAGFDALSHRGLAVDATGRLHVAYGGRFLYYAVSDGENWHHETVDDAPWVGAGGASLVLDPAGHPHLAYCDGENLAIKYAYRNDNGWQVESVSGAMKAEAEPQGSGGSGSCAVSLALDREGEPHIAFFGKLPGYNLWYAHREAEGWRAEVVDFTQNSGMEPSLALDSQDHPHIAYYTGYPSYKLWYAYWEDGWHRQLLRDLPGHDGDVGQYPSLALDAQDHFHISYYDATEGNLEYMAGSPRAWDIEIVDADGDVGQSTSLVLDNAGQPHVSYSAASPVPAVKYAYRDALGWHVDTVADQVEVSGDTALALDLAGRPFVGFVGRGDDTVNVLQVASQHSAGGWITAVVDRSGEAGQDSSLVLDAAGYPHISYHAADYGGALARSRLEYTWRDTAGWHRETVDTKRYTGWGWGSSLALDADGRPHISYLHNESESIRYAYRDGDGWHVETVDPSTWNVSATSLALDPLGNPHVAYIANGLRHAYRDEGGWHVDTIDPAGDPGARVSLAIDAMGRLHISYRMSDTPKPSVALRYAYRDGDGWHLETIDADGDVGEHSSLVLDAAGHPHIAYYVGYPYHHLRYASRGTTTWYIERAWPDGDVGRFPSLVLDGEGWAHISCHCRLPSGWTALCLVARDRTTWRLSLLTEGAAFVGVGTSLALDRAGRPHITYAFDGGLKYGYFAPMQPLYLPLVTRG
jgi:hypothetical protein